MNPFRKFIKVEPNVMTRIDSETHVISKAGAVVEISYEKPKCSFCKQEVENGSELLPHVAVCCLKYPAPRIREGEKY